MVCNKCFNPGSKNEVLGKTYYYCRTCKDEIIESSRIEKGVFRFATEGKREFIAGDKVKVLTSYVVRFINLPGEVVSSDTFYRTCVVKFYDGSVTTSLYEELELA